MGAGFRCFSMRMIGLLKNAGAFRPDRMNIPPVLALVFNNRLTYTQTVWYKNSGLRQPDFSAILY
jgi:hypothetical protein